METIFATLRKPTLLGPQEDRTTTASTSSQTSSSNGVERARMIARLAAETRAHSLVILDLRKVVDWVDFMIVGTGTSRRQLKAVADRIEEAMEELGEIKLSRSDSDQWIAVDFGDIVVHLFDEKGREYYQLDDYWGDADRISWEEEPRDSEASSSPPSYSSTDGEADHSEPQG